MLRKIKLYGDLAEFVGHEEFEVQVDNVAKAVSFLIHNFPQLEKYMSPKYYQVKVGNYEIDETEIPYPVGQEDIHFVPVIAGAGGGARKLLLGAALIGGAFLFGPAGFMTAKGASITTGVVIAKSAVFIGASLALQGVSEILFPLPKLNDEEDPRLSFSFSGIQNTTRSGTSVPIVYGEIFTGSVVISSAIDNNQVVIDETET
jgi:predicted phage tail protein